MTDEQAERLAQAGYEAYGEQVGWANHRGRTMPAWGLLAQPQHDAWLSAARAIAAKATTSAAQSTATKAARKAAGKSA